MQHHPADQLNVEMTHLHAPLARLANDREALGQQIVERRPPVCALAQNVEPRPQLLVAVELDLGLEGIDLSDSLLVATELLALAHVEGTIENSHLLSLPMRRTRPAGT